MILDCVRAELLKLRHRPAVWVLAALQAGTVLLFNYVLLWSLAAGGVLDEAGPGAADAVLAELLPARLGYALVQSGTSFGGAFVLILGALVIGSEYRWGTVKTVLTQRPGRGSVIAGQLVALLILTASFALLVAVVSAGASIAVRALESAASPFPDVADLVGAVLALWLLLSTWAAVGAGLASVFRGTGLAIGIGLVLALIVDAGLAAIPLSGVWSTLVGHLTLTANATALSGAFGATSAVPGAVAATASPGQAVAALFGWLLVFAAVAVVPFVRREVR